MSDDAYIANKQVTVAGGRQFGPGQIIDGDFDPDAPDNALLIDEGLISASTAPLDAPEGESAESPAGDPEAGSGAQDGPRATTGKPGTKKGKTA